MDNGFLKTTVLFRGFDDSEISIALQRLSAKEISYNKGETILHSGDNTQSMGVVISGSVTIENDDIWGNRTILSHIEKKGFFAETYALLENEPLMVNVVASEDCTILFLRIAILNNPNALSDKWRAKLVANMLEISAHKNLSLSTRSFHTAPKTIRGRVMAYLDSISIKRHDKEFDIPFDRQQLADYLNLERSALSKELGKMQRDGLITVRKNHFIIHTSLDRI